MLPFFLHCFYCLISNSDASGGWGYSSSSFIFSLINKEGLTPFKSMVNSPQHAIYRESGYGPIFGGGHAILISNYANSSTNSYTDFRNNYYHIPSGVQNRLTILAGSYKFTPDEVEVFYLTWVTWHRERRISDGVDLISFFLPQKLSVS